MKKYFIIFAISAIFYSQASAHDLHIVNREDWWANEEYTNIKSQYWTEILINRESKRLQSLNTPKTPEQLQKSAEAAKLSKSRINYVNKNYASRYALSSTQYYNWDIKLAWPVKKSQKIDGIILHHTATEYDSSLEWIQSVYKFHGIGREWWDIWYNFIIWYNGEIYEWRLGWDYAMWGHTSWNNYSTLWVALLWNYNEREMTIAQRNSLEDLLSHLIYKYDISMLKTLPLHKTCTDCVNGLTTENFQPIAGHRDGGHTSCPGDNIYKIIPELNAKFKSEQISYNKAFIKIANRIKSYDDQKLQNIYLKIQYLEEKDTSEKNKYIISRLKDIIGAEISSR